MPRHFGHFVLHYGIALVAVAVIYVVHEWVLSPLAGGARAPLTYLLSVALAAAYGGVGPGLFAVVFGVVCAALPLLLPQSTHDGIFVELIQVALLAICGVIIAFLFGRLHMARAHPRAPAPAGARHGARAARLRRGHARRQGQMLVGEVVVLSLIHI